MKWNKVAMEAGQRARVFCASMADVFEWNSSLNQSRQRLWDLIEQTPALDWLLLTKRPHLVNRLAPWGNHWPHNVWIGTTAENQKWADKRMKHLANIPARIRFLSCEPLLAEIDLSKWLNDGHLDWVIAGGESGSNARPSDPAWFRSLRNQCAKHDVAFLFKQWGDWFPIEEGESVDYIRKGKKVAGRELDGQTWDDLPRGNRKLIWTSNGSSCEEGASAA